MPGAPPTASRKRKVEDDVPSNEVRQEEVPAKKAKTKTTTKPVGGEAVGAVGADGADGPPRTITESLDMMVDIQNDIFREVLRMRKSMQTELEGIRKALEVIAGSATKMPGKDVAVETDQMMVDKDQTMGEETSEVGKNDM